VDHATPIFQQGPLVGFAAVVSPLPDITGGKLAALQPRDLDKGCKFR